MMMDSAGTVDTPRADVVHPLPIMLLVQIVNQWGNEPRMAAHGGTRPYPSVDALRAENPDIWSRFPAIDEVTLVETANLVYPVFASETGAECSEHLNAILGELRMSYAFASEESSVREVWRLADSDDALLAGAALCLMNHFRLEPDSGRLGTCEGDACVDVYVDQSPSRRRRYCSLTCQNRNRTRAYRASLRTAAGS